MSFKEFFVLHSSEVTFSVLIKKSRQKPIEIETAFFIPLEIPRVAHWIISFMLHISIITSPTNWYLYNELVEIFLKLSMKTVQVHLIIWTFLVLIDVHEFCFTSTPFKHHPIRPSQIPGERVQATRHEPNAVNESQLFDDLLCLTQRGLIFIYGKVDIEADVLFLILSNDASGSGIELVSQFPAEHVCHNHSHTKGCTFDEQHPCIFLCGGSDPSPFRSMVQSIADSCGTPSPYRTLSPLFWHQGFHWVLGKHMVESLSLRLNVISKDSMQSLPQ